MATKVCSSKKKMNRTRKGESSKQGGATFSQTELETSFVRYCQLMMSESGDPTTLEGRIKKRLRQEVEFIGNPEFGCSESEIRILGEELLATSILADSKPTKIPDLPTHLKRMCEPRLLKPEEERSLFERMNYLRYKAQCLQSQLDPQL